MPDQSGVTNLTGIAAICTACGTFVIGIFSKTGVDSRIKAVDKKIDKLGDQVIYEGMFEEYQTAQTNEHTHLNNHC